MQGRMQGYAEGLITTAAGTALLLAENFDLFTRVIGLLAVVLGLIYSTTRFFWEIEDRREKKRLFSAKPSGVSRIEPCESH
jgi:hypothetical protein